MLGEILEAHGGQDRWRQDQERAAELIAISTYRKPYLTLCSTKAQQRSLGLRNEASK